MPRKREEYKQWQDRYESLYNASDENWSDETKRKHVEDMAIAKEQELRGRLEARERRGNNTDVGHDEKIECVRDSDLSLKHTMSIYDGRCKRTDKSMRDVDPKLKRETEEDNNSKKRQGDVGERLKENRGY